MSRPEQGPAGWRRRLLGGPDSWRRIVLAGLGGGVTLALFAALIAAIVGDGGAGSLDPTPRPAAPVAAPADGGEAPPAQDEPVATEPPQPAATEAPQPTEPPPAAPPTATQPPPPPTSTPPAAPPTVPPPTAEGGG